MFSGALFEEITPEYYNVRGSGTNIISLFRFDTDKRRAVAAINGPLGGSPKWRYRVGADFRNENWTVQTSFTGPSTFLGATNLRRESVDAEITRFVGARWTLDDWRGAFAQGFSQRYSRRRSDARIGGERLSDQAKSTVHIRTVAVAGKTPGNFQQRQFPGGTLMVATGAVF